MSLQASPIPDVPAETARVARAAFAKGNRYLTWRDELGPLYADEQFAELFARRGQPAESPASLALVTILQFMENLSDRQAADAVRSRMDWKYLLGLELTDTGFNYSVLTDFRQRLRQGQAEVLLLDRLLDLARARGLLKARGQQRTDSTHVLAAIRHLNRLELVGEAMRQALNRLADVAPEWLQGWVPAEWYSRYGRRIEQFRLPKEVPAQQAWAHQVGADGQQLLEACWAPQAPATVRRLPTVECLRRIWVQQYGWRDGQRYWRPDDEHPPAALLITSPYDCEARFGTKRTTEWVGYKAQVTESCDPDQPALITQVTTTVASTPDQQMLPVIQAALAAKDLLPAEHLVDAGYPSAEHLVTSQRQYQVAVIGPVPQDTSWQAQAHQGFDLRHFHIDWAQQQVTCPRGRVSRWWSPRRDAYGRPRIHVRFAASDCQPCPLRPACTQAKEARTLRLQLQPESEALQAARERQTTPEFKARYAGRAGIEASLSQAVRRCDVRHCRYIGLAKTQVQHILTAVALNLLRLLDWLVEPDHRPRSSAAFAALAPAAQFAN